MGAEDSEEEELALQSAREAHRLASIIALSSDEIIGPEVIKVMREITDDISLIVGTSEITRLGAWDEFRQFLEDRMLPLRGVEGSGREEDSPPLRLKKRVLRDVVGVVRNPAFQTAEFKCIGDYEKCIASRGPDSVLCTYALIICLARRLLPFVR